MLGLARAALARVLETVQKGKPIAHSVYQRSIDSPSYQLAIADAAALIDTATLHVYRSADGIDAAPRERIQLDVLTRARVRCDPATAATRCRESVGLLLNAGGASSSAQANPLQRIWRDLEPSPGTACSTSTSAVRSTAARCWASRNRSCPCSDAAMVRSNADISSGPTTGLSRRDHAVSIFARFGSSKRAAPLPTGERQLHPADGLLRG